MEFKSLRLQSICGILRYRPQTTHWRAIDRKYHIIGVQITGGGRHDFGNRALQLSEGNVYFLNQSEDYDVSLVAIPSESYSIHFTTYEPICTESFFKKTVSIEKACRLIESVDRYRLQGNDAMATSEFYRFCHLIGAAKNAPYAPSDARIAQAKEEMDLYFQEEDCLQKAAQKSGVSRRRFNDLFAVQYGLTPNRYLISCKIKRAKELLRIGYLSLSEIALLCGFRDVYYFSRVFKTEVGCTAGEYRNKEK